MNDSLAGALNIIGEIRAGHETLAEVEASPMPPCTCGSYSLHYYPVGRHQVCPRAQEGFRRTHNADERRVADLEVLPVLLAIAEAGLALAEGVEALAYGDGPEAGWPPLVQLAERFDAAVKALAAVRRDRRAS